LHAPFRADQPQKQVAGEDRTNVVDRPFTADPKTIDKARHTQKAPSSLLVSRAELALSAIVVAIEFSKRFAHEADDACGRRDHQHRM